MPLREEAKWRRGRKESLRQVNVGHPVYVLASTVCLQVLSLKKMFSEAFLSENDF